MPAKLLANRQIVLAGVATHLRSQVQATLDGLGAQALLVALDGVPGPTPAELKVEAGVSEALDRLQPLSSGADGVIYVSRDPGPGEDLADYLEESIGGYHFFLKLAKRLQSHRAIDVLAIMGATEGGEAAALAADVRTGALKQMTKVAASEAGPLSPTLLANALCVSGVASDEASVPLSALFERMLRRPQGYLTGTSLSLSL